MKEFVERFSNFGIAKNEVLKTLRDAGQEDPRHRVGFVSGLIMSEGPALAIKNIGYLLRYARFARNRVDFPVFSAINFLGEESPIRAVYGGEESRRLWREILESGVITDLFMTPRWNESTGARDEYETAKKMGIRIYQVKWRNNLPNPQATA